MNSGYSRSHSSHFLDSAGRSGPLEVELAQAIKRAGLSSPAGTQALRQPHHGTKRRAILHRSSCVIALLNFLTGQPQIAIRSKYVNGALRWTVYNPSTDTLKQFDSEQAVRAWVERGDA
ncbi:MAG: hypothetical protein DCF25_03330 [Leptolyngbya foveolarum]|uniref:Uncharacterized protein n=1 Tax=Leptolyngbya foveolarum TaxID=47253 RepID=A0A2W4UP80_9CYAN|nr:MAG: hypothetical protein DCF25_03330 [Leptolyngbya foveolarum]